jgi:hypothetical protein
VVVVVLLIIIRACLFFFLLFYFNIGGTSGTSRMRRPHGSRVNGRWVHKKRVITTSIITIINSSSSHSSGCSICSILLGEWVKKVGQLMIGIGGEVHMPFILKDVTTVFICLHINVHAHAENARNTLFYIESLVFETTEKMEQHNE